MTQLILPLLEAGFIIGFGFYTLYRAKHADRLESAGKLFPAYAARLRDKPWQGWVFVGIGLLVFVAQRI